MQSAGAQPSATPTAAESGATLRPALAAECRELRGRAGPLACYVGGPAGGAPLLLVHSINAAASSFEVKPAFDWAVAQGRRVYAPDLPGFGRSPRGPRPYTIRLYTDAVHDALDAIAAAHGAAPVDALGLSLGSEFVARAATESPARFRTLALVTPTGFRRGDDHRTGPQGAGREVPGLHAAFNNGLWGQAIFDLLVSRRSVTYFMQRTFGSKDVPPALIDYAHESAHQPGARHAPYAFVSGRLFARDVRAVYERLAVPVWVPHATRGDFRDFSAAGWAQAKSNWTFTPMPAGAMVFWEQPAAFFESYARFLAAA